MYLNEERLDEAGLAFAEAKALDPNNPDFWIFRIKSYIKAKNYAKAMEEINEIISHSVGSTGGVVESRGDGEQEDGDTVLTKVFSGEDQNGPSVDAIMLRAKLHMLLQRPDLAQRDVGWAYSLQPLNVEVRELLDRLAQRSKQLYGNATANLLAGKHDAAAKACEKYLATEPLDVEAVRAAWASGANTPPFRLSDEGGAWRRFVPATRAARWARPTACSSARAPASPSGPGQSRSPSAQRRISAAPPWRSCAARPRRARR